jgi:hypothetical protein
VLILLASGWLFAVNPRLTNGVQLVAGSSPFPCQTATACSANSGAEILYQTPNANVNGCAEMYSMSVAGTGNVNLTTKIYGNGFGAGPTYNQGVPLYSPDGQWILFSQQQTGSEFPCTNHSVFTGQSTDTGIAVCDTATYSNCAMVLSFTVGQGQGALHPQWSRDGTKIFYGTWTTHTSSGEYGKIGTHGKLQWATFVPGTPPSITSVSAGVDPQGDGTGSTNFYEPWDSDGALGGASSCWFYYAANISPGGGLSTQGIGRYNICTGATSIPSTPYTNAPGCYSEFWAFSTAHPDMALTASGCPYATFPLPNAGYSVLDIVMAEGTTGAGAIQLTGYNLAGQPEYAYPILVSAPRWSYDATFITFAVTSNASLAGVDTGYAGSTGTKIWKYNVNLIPSQVVGNTSLTGKAQYK